MKWDLRIKRIEAQILQIISLSILEANNEKLKSVIITRIELSRDLKKMKVYFRTLKIEEKEENLKALERSKGYFKSAIKKNTVLKFIPEIGFLYEE